MKQSVDFTIVTPSYNYSQYIRDMLESVVIQDGVTYEHLIFDAGSTDGTLDIIREYDHVQLTVETDKGMSDAINKGFKAAKGKWVMWLNTDDRLKSGVLLKVKDFSEQHEDADVIYGAWDFIDTEGNYQRTMQAFPFQKMMLSQMCYIASTSTFFRKSSVMDDGFFLNERFKYVMDGEYYNRLARAGKIFKHYKQVIADFRVHGENLSMKYIGVDSIEGVLDCELMRAESRSIKRSYGLSMFKNDMLNGCVDCVLHYWFRLIKGILKCLNPPQK